MSASLDDLEPYEVFQQDLEEYLNAYKNDTSHTKPVINHLYILHSFIEYFCFINPKSDFHTITPDEISDSFLTYLIKKYDYSISQYEVKSSLLCFFNFINLKIKAIPKELLNLKSE